jgi:pimeloyl-ACP methyl ester carboxylesterase
MIYLWNWLKGTGYLRTMALALVMAATFAITSSVGRTQREGDRSQVAMQGLGRAPQVIYRTVKVDGLDIFYREAGPKDAPVVLLLHGFPTSSHMFRNLIPALADKFHLIAPDYPGFGNSSMPRVDEFDYTFDSLAQTIDSFTEKLGLTGYSLYLQDYGAPIGFRLAVKHPERVQALVIQNGNAYEEGLRDFWKPIKAYWKERTPENTAALEKFLAVDATRWQYIHGVRNIEAISPDNWLIDQHLLDRPGNKQIQLQLFYSYGSNPPLYPRWQAYLRKHQPPTLIVWGKNDQIFPAEGAYPYKHDLKEVELHLLDTGHFALEEDGEVIAALMRRFLEAKVLGRGDAGSKNK